VQAEAHTLSTGPAAFLRLSIAFVLPLGKHFGCAALSLPASFAFKARLAGVRLLQRRGRSHDDHRR